MLNQQYYGSNVLFDVEIQSSFGFNRVFFVFKDQHGNVLGEKDGDYRASSLLEHNQKLKITLSSFYPTDQKNIATVAVGVRNNSGRREVSSNTVDFNWCRTEPCPMPAAATTAEWRQPIADAQYYGDIFIDATVRNPNGIQRLLAVAQDENGNIMGEHSLQFRSAAPTELSSKSNVLPSREFGFSRDEKHTIILALKTIDPAGNETLAPQTKTVLWCRDESCEVVPNTPPTASLSGINPHYQKNRVGCAKLATHYQLQPEW